jgi:hypothetical protein
MFDNPTPFSLVWRGGFVDPPSRFMPARRRFVGNDILLRDLPTST